MEKYPGIKVQAFDLGGDDVLAKALEEQKAGAFTGDVWAAVVALSWLGLLCRTIMSGALYPIALQL